MNIDKLETLIKAFILYEIAEHGVDPRMTLEGTDLRLEASEGYKYTISNECLVLLNTNGNYIDKVYRLLGRNQNLVDHHQITKFKNMAMSDKREYMEMSLAELYEDNNDEVSFEVLYDAIGCGFDLLGFLMFAKDSRKYLPIRSKNFDERFALLDIDSKLAGNVSWEKYCEFIALVQAVQSYLKKHLNDGVTLLDAHSFIWLLPYIMEYASDERQLIEHKKFGRGVITKVENDYVYIKFGKVIKKFIYETSLNEGIIKLIPIKVNIYGKDTENLKEDSLLEIDLDTVLDKKVEIINSEHLLEREPYHIDESKNVNKSYPSKVDYIKQQIWNKKIGDFGENKVVYDEKEFLITKGRKDLGEKVHIVESDSYGYDVLSFKEDGSEKHIEVKTSTSSSDEIVFHISENEVRTAATDSHYELHYLYNIYGKDIKKVIFTHKDLNDTIFDYYMKPTQYIVKIPSK